MAYGRMVYGLFCTTAYATLVMEMRLRLCVRACERTVWHFLVQVATVRAAHIMYAQIT